MCLDAALPSCAGGLDGARQEPLGTGEVTARDERRGMVGREGTPLRVVRRKERRSAPEEGRGGAHVTEVERASPRRSEERARVFSELAGPVVEEAELNTRLMGLLEVVADQLLGLPSQAAAIDPLCQARVELRPQLLRDPVVRGVSRTRTWWKRKPSSVE